MQENFEDEYVLWSCFQKGNKLAYAYLYKKYVYHLLSYGLQFTSNRELIKDCVQDVFLQLYTYRVNINPQKIKIYLLICMRNQMYMLLSKQPAFQEDIDSSQESIEISDNSIEDNYILNESSAAMEGIIKATISQLSLHQREIIHYRFMDNLTMEQISELMDMNIQSAYNLLHRAIKKMRELMKKNAFE